MSSELTGSQSVGIAEDQGKYQDQIDQLLSFIGSIRPSSAVELLIIATRRMKARAYGVVRAIEPGKLEVEAEWPEKRVDWARLQAVLSNHLITGSTRSQLVLIPKEFCSSGLLPKHSRSLLLSRLGTHPDEPDWLRALAFIEREQAPVRGASLGFLTRDFSITERMADWYGMFADASYQLPWQTYALRQELTHRLGLRVKVEIRDGEFLVSGIEPWKEMGQLATQAMAEECIRVSFGWRILEQTFLQKGASLPTVRGTVDEFHIVVWKYPVYGRKISVRQLPEGTESEVMLPVGWWWVTDPQELVISGQDAELTALGEERSRQPDVPDLMAHLVETVLWPDNGTPRRVVHEVKVTSERGLGATYFINAHDGSIVTRRQTVRM